MPCFPKYAVLKPEDLPALGFRLVDKLSHDDLIFFVLRNIRRKGFFIKLWVVASMVNVTLLLVVAAFHLLSGEISFITLAKAFLLAMLLLFMLIPLHEWLHALAYRWAGAKKVSYQVNWKKLYVAALADRFVISREPFYAVGLAPFIVISIFMLVAIFAINPFWQVSVLLTLLLHTLSCVGDFAMINYMQLRPETEVVTYDEVEKEHTYFWVKS